MDLLPDRPSVRLADDLAVLLRVLDEHRGWLKSEQLRRLHPRLAPRRVRELAEASGGQVISCTARGYRLTRHASPDEVRHSLADLKSRARKLLARHLATAKAWHRAAHHRLPQ